MDALGLKDNANNVYKNNVNNEALLKELGPLARRGKRESLVQQREHFSHGTIDISIKQHGYVHSMYYITAHK